MLTPKTVSFSKNATNVFFHLLTQCNLSCRHCYINPSQHGDIRLDFKTICQWLELFAQGKNSANLVLLGGEPTLHPDLADIIRHAKKTGYASITVDTNGFLFHDIIHRVDPGDLNYFSFSLDGACPDTNDRIRGKGVYEKCVSGLKQAVDRGFQTSLIYTVSRMNMDELLDMPALLKKWGVGRFFIQVIGIRGKSAESDPDELQLSKQQWEQLAPKAAKMAAELGICATYPKVFLEKDETFECAGLVADNYFIFPNGRVYRCPLCEDFPIHAMEVKDKGLVLRPPINESDLFHLNIAEGCVMNRLIQPKNLTYGKDGTPDHKIACCILKEEIRPA